MSRTWQAKFGAVMVAVLMLVGCDIGGVSRQTLDYNLDADRANNQLLLLNILRASQRRPVQMTSIRVVQGTATLQGQLGLAAPLRQFGAKSALLLSPQVTGSAGPQFQDDILDTQEFYQGFLKPFLISLIDYYMNQGYPPGLLYHLLTRSIVAKAGNQVFTAVNSVGDPDLHPEFSENYMKFRALVEVFLDAKLVTEPITEKTNIGPPLSAMEAKQKLRELVTASTAKDGPDIVYDKAHDKYQLQKTEKSARFCLQADPDRDGIGPATGKSGEFVTLALAMRCGASAEERDRAEKLVAGHRNEAPATPGEDRTLLLSAACPPTEGNLDGYIARYCYLVSQVHRISMIPANPSELLQLQITTKSSEGVLYYLGEVARRSLANIEDRNVLIPLAPFGKNKLLAGEVRCGTKTDPNFSDKYYPCLPLLVIERGDRGAPAFVDVDYDGTRYSVPAKRSEAGLTSQAFELVHQLFALNKAGKDLPATTILTVTGIR